MRALAAAVVLGALLTAPASAHRSTGVLLDYATASLQPGPALRFDGAGIVQQRYGDRWYYNPFTVAQQGLIDYSHYRVTRSLSRRRGALRAADWLVRHQDRTGAWLYRFRFVASGLEVSPPWASALAQGGALCLLRRAFHLTGDERYRRAALRALRPFRRPSSRVGGVAATIRRHRFYEEYPTRPASGVLNGFAFSLIGLYDAQDFSPDARRLLTAGRRSLLWALPHYDQPHGAPAYDLTHLTVGRPPFVIDSYWPLDLQLLQTLDSVTAGRPFRPWVERWSDSLAPAAR
jgi:heparosan-N-sulfate-glucuronate 5-epimerase